LAQSSSITLVAQPPAAAHDGLAAHVAGQELPDVPRREDVRVDDDGAALVAHELGRQEAQGGERLQVLVAPDPLLAADEVGLPFPRLQERVVLVLDDLDPELVGVRRGAAHGVGRDQSAQVLLLVGVHEHAELHRVAAFPVGLAGGWPAVIRAAPARQVGARTRARGELPRAAVEPARPGR
jgi:hypothetical protein